MRKIQKTLIAFGIGCLFLMASVIFVACGNNNGGNGMKLDSEIALTIRQDYFNSSPRGADIESIDYVRIHVYFGTFNGAIAVSIDDGFNLMIDIWGGTETVAGRTFNYPQPGHQVLVWHDGSFYTLTQAFEKGLLTSGNIGIIWNIHQK
ncbi:MAG: hypothetical protein FWE01_01270 [Firmicutes bacterium]|nr:hypothetical protein [Bacillota bacterium]